MIHLATVHDRERLLGMARAFVRHYGIADYDEETCDQMIAGMIERPDAVLLVSDNGMIGGVVYPHFFNRHQLMAQELFWWVDPAARNTREGFRLLKAFEAWAKEMGANRISMIALPMQESVGAFYERVGYRPLERAYVREL